MLRILLALLLTLGLVVPTEAKPKRPTASHAKAKSGGKASSGKSSRSSKASGKRGGSSRKSASRSSRGSRSGGRRSSRSYGRTRSVVAPMPVVGSGQPSDDLGAGENHAAPGPEELAQQARAAAARGDNAEALSRYLHLLSRKPDDVTSLVGAGRAALGVGDLNAATGFFAHAQDIAPNNDAVEAGLGAVSVQNNDPRAALRYLRAAEDHGAAAAELASDRALAYDLRGDPRRAQAEYALALKARPGNAALLRRLALSQAIGGDRTAALNTLDPLLRRQDVAAWRTRAFVRAMTGDVAGAEADAATVVPAYQLDQLKPYLARLATLRPAEKAAAVNLGRFPQAGAAGQVAQARVPDAPKLGFDLQGIPGAAAAPVRAEPQPAPQTAMVAPRAAAPPLPRPQADEPRPTPPQIVAPAPVVTSVAPPAVAPVTRPPAAEPTNVAGPPAPTPSTVGAQPVAAPPAIVAEAKPAPMATMSTPIVHKEPAATTPAKPPTPDPAAQAKAKADAKAAALAAEKEKARKAAAAEAAKEAARAAAVAKANPARSFVQVAGGANKADLPKEWAKLKKKWPKQLGGQSPWTMHYRFTNRLMIGPFPSAAAAQKWVGDRGKEGFSTFRVDTDAGEAVERLGG